MFDTRGGLSLELCRRGIPMYSFCKIRLSCAGSSRYKQGSSAFKFARCGQALQ
jgi:hypothetical protein